MRSLSIAHDVCLLGPIRGRSHLGLGLSGSGNLLGHQTQHTGGTLGTLIFDYGDHNDSYC